MSPDGGQVYVAGTSGIATYGRHPSTGALTFSEIDAVNVRDGYDIEISSDGRHMYVANFPLAVFSRDLSTGDLQFVEHETLGGDVVDSSNDGLNVYAFVTFGGAPEIRIHTRDAATGQLTYLTTTSLNVQAGNFESGGGIAVSPDGDQVYAAASRSERLVVYARSSVDGSLTQVQQFEHGSHVADLAHPRSVAISPEGSRLYVLGFSGLNTFARDPGTGLLTHRRALFESDGPFVEFGGIVAGPDGQGAYATPNRRLTRFGRNGDVAIRHVGGVDGMPGAILGHDGPTIAVGCPALSPDGSHLYVLGDNGLEIVELVSLCEDQPRPGCRAPRAAKLSIRDFATADDGDSIGFTWLGGDETPLASLGDPIGGATRYALCVYDESGGGPTLLVDALVPDQALCPAAATCWTQTGPPSAQSGLRFRGPRQVGEGLRLVARSGLEGRSRMSTLGRNRQVPLPALPAFPLTEPVSAQLVNSDGECWSGTFAGDDVRLNGALDNGQRIFRAWARP